ncbi:MAG: hypothetical protein ABS81_07270 [Pseudonocardia sp. SCN 72-86]|nr:MAG: hypothetical protein ABS81_07270 [Pseudonocardia sp. SCN 72-86]
MTTAQQIADLLGVDEGDVRVVVESMIDLHDEELPPEIIRDVHDVLDQHGIRTTPAEWYPAVWDEWKADGMPVGSAYHRWFHTTKDFRGRHYPNPLGD